MLDVALRYRNLLPMAVTSGSSRSNVKFQHNAIGVYQYFHVIVTVDDGRRPKPNPDNFVEAARCLEVASNVCQVLEDADLGLEAAQSAGMLAIDVR